MRSTSVWDTILLAMVPSLTMGRMFRLSDGEFASSHRAVRGPLVIHRRFHLRRLAMMSLLAMKNPQVMTQIRTRGLRVPDRTVAWTTGKFTQLGAPWPESMSTGDATCISPGTCLIR